MEYVVSYGNVFDGIRLVGPFSTFEEAFEFADGSDGPWEIAELEAPLDDDEELRYFECGHPIYNGDTICASLFCNEWNRERGGDVGC